MIGREALRNRLVHNKENLYFAITAFIGIISYILLFFSVIGIAISLIIMIFSFLAHSLSMASIRRNGVRVSKNQFPHIYEKAEILAAEMELAVIPSIYVMESSGILNAFASRFFGKNMVVIYSEIFDLSDEREDQLLFVLAHEFAHLKRRHVLVHTILLPSMFVPLLGEAYLRACEYTCDRYAAFYVNNSEASKEALAMLAIGKKLAPQVNKEAYIEQIREESGFFAWMSEKLSTHPDLPKRINSLDNWLDPEQKPLVKEKKKSLALGLAAASIIGILIIAAAVGIGTWTVKSGVLDTFLDEAGQVQGSTPLMEAASSNDIEKLGVLLAGGANLEAKDNEGSTALQWAVSNDSAEAAKFLLKHGANVNTRDSWKDTPLINAVFNDSSVMAALLIQAGADPSYEDTEGLTAYDYAVDNENEQLQSLLSRKNSHIKKQSDI
ncbi:M48 family metallopeptidase [Peribacillus sp. B-H-3]|uniref:M48 family metallopeptidase n=1 Tax=Peribacillus sp. B-H-3 TaxID=3400420 RepID=UPI003B027D40